MKNIDQYENYVFIFAHPDDEVYSCGFMYKLIQSGKKVCAIFVTSGDAGVNAGSREAEVKASMAAIGVPEDCTALLGFPEKEVPSSFPAILVSLEKAAKEFAPDCIVGMDYEGGHEVHDSASFLASQLARKMATTQYVFPVYHVEDGRRIAASFVPGRMATDTISLTADDVGIKIKVLEAHRGQLGHFLHLQRQSPEYFQRLFGREVFRAVAEPIDYLERPCDEIGYEAHRNGYKFVDFQAAVKEASV